MSEVSGSVPSTTAAVAVATARSNSIASNPILSSVNAQPAGSSAVSRIGPRAEMQHGKMALILWCRSMTQSFQNVDIVDFGDSWQDGLAFCAILNRFVGKEVIDFKMLTKNTRSDNLLLAFNASDKLGVPKLLSIEDMTDKRNIFTWITHLYHSLIPALQGTLIVQRGLNGNSPNWRKESIRLIQNRFSLTLSPTLQQQNGLSGTNNSLPPSPKQSENQSDSSKQQQQQTESTSTSTTSSQKQQQQQQKQQQEQEEENFLINTEDLQWINLSMARITQLPYTELHKELRNSELDKRAIPLLAIYSGPLLLLLTSDNIHDVDAWFAFFTQQIIGSVIVGAPPPPSNPQISTYDGWLYKKGDRGPNKSWKKRFFVLRDNRIRYANKSFTWMNEGSGSNLSPSSNSSSSSPSSFNQSTPPSAQVQKMTYSLKLCTGITPQPSIHPFCFTVDFPCRSLVLRGETKMAMESWVDVLKRTRESYLRTAHQLVPTREKEGIVRVESLSVTSGFYYATAKQGLLFLADKEKPSVNKAKIPLYESESEVCDLQGVTQQSVRLLIGSREARNSRVYYVSGVSLEDTLDWFEVIVRQKQLMAAYVNASAWPSTPNSQDDEDEDVENPQKAEQSNLPRVAATRTSSIPPSS